MKRIIIIAMFIVGISTFIESKPDKLEMAYGSFYGYLNPYGVWMEFNDGLVVWRPTIMRKAWTPYSVGRWIWTDYGWYWDSYEPFGYITYHYGRWYYDDYYGWIWIPDYEWAPAWVEWRYDNMYVGWAPLPPYAVFSINIGIHFTFNYVTPYTYWNFVSYNYMCNPYAYKYYVAPKYKYRIYSDTKYRNDYGYSNGRIVNIGVDIDEVRTRSGQDIRIRTIQQVSNPRELKEQTKTRDDGSIRTFIASREELGKDRSRDNIDIRRIERNSTLETSRLQIGERRERNDDLELKNRFDRETNVVREKESRDLRVDEKKKVENENSNPIIRRDKVRVNESDRNQKRINSEPKREENRINSERQRREELNINKRRNQNDM